MSDLLSCPFCKGGVTRIDPHGQIWRGQGYSDPICWRLVHFCTGILPDEYVTNRMELRARTEEQCVEAWNSRAQHEARAKDEARVKALVEALDVARDGLEWAEAHLMDHGTISATVSYATQKTRTALAAMQEEDG